MEDKVTKKEEEGIAIEKETTVAKLVVRCLENEGVKYVFGIPGEENIHFIDALAQSTIRFIIYPTVKRPSHQSVLTDPLELTYCNCH